MSVREERLRLREIRAGANGRVVAIATEMRDEYVGQIEILRARAVEADDPAQGLDAHEYDMALYVLRLWDTGTALGGATRSCIADMDAPGGRGEDPVRLEVNAKLRDIWRRMGPYARFVVEVAVDDREVQTAFELQWLKAGLNRI